MAAEGRREPDAVRPRRRGPAPPPSVEQRLFSEGFAFDPFQAVRLLQRLRPDLPRVGESGPPSAEPVRFRALSSLSFPASPVYDIARPAAPNSPAELVQAYLGLTGPTGVLPRHYTELLMRLDRERRDPERYALRDWFDLFNHRLASLFHRAWEKYRAYLGYERSGGDPSARDPFTFALLCLVGLGQPALNGRLRVRSVRPGTESRRPETLARVDDLALVYYGGLLAHRPRSAVALEALLRDYFGLPVEVRQFQGQWLQLDPVNQTRLGDGDGNNRLGYNALAGERVWDVQSKFRIRLGPLGYRQFRSFLPDHGPNPDRKAFFVLGHLVRYFVGPELDFDVQLLLRAGDVPDSPLPGQGEDGPALGWNVWLHSQPLTADADDAVFEGVGAAPPDLVGEP